MFFPEIQSVNDVERIARRIALAIAEPFDLGGHSVDDPELKYGMVVLGMIHPDRIVKNSGARVGDVLVLTNPDVIKAYLGATA